MSQFKVGDSIMNLSGKVGRIVCVMENGKGGFCYAVIYTDEPTRTFLNREKSLRRL